MPQYSSAFGAISCLYCGSTETYYTLANRFEGKLLGKAIDYY